MVVINSSTFRSNQSKYLELASGGENIVITRNNRPSVVVCSVHNFDLKPSRDLTGNLIQALHEVKDEKSGKIELQSARDFLDEL